MCRDRAVDQGPESVRGEDRVTLSNDPFAERFGPDGCRRFDDGLVLPVQVGPYFHTLAEEPAGLGAYADAIGAELPAPEQRAWTRLGSDRAYDIVADPQRRVHGLLIRYADEPLVFVNSSPEAFAASLLGLDELLDTLASTDDPGRAAAAFAGLEERLAALDPEAFADRGSWWPLVLDDIRDTSSVENYAAFEILDDNGDKQVFTSSGSICLHPEERVWRNLEAAGIQPEQVVRIYTELEACAMPGHYCSMWFALAFPNARVTHSFPYGETAESRSEGIRQLRAALAQRGRGE
ncbi:nucleic acid/nucleotide deaminase domain-containing protein [Kitasatospora paranensis]|uniref:Nucleic acid/nucleotide deaminase domain-containing protein n=1 Tax=Kitasatospora paranensis TaxID=258053 RepID=A0ABW2FQ95_9ACTN